MGDEPNPRLPSWNGDWATFKVFETRVSLEIDGTKKEDRSLLGPRLAKNLSAKAWEMLETVDREALRADNGAEYLVKFLKDQRGKDKVDLLGDAMRDLLHKADAQRNDGEEVMDYLPRYKTYVKAIQTAFEEINKKDAMPEEFFGWHLLTVGVRLDPSDVANVKAKASGYGLDKVENTLKLMWSGGGLAQKDAERKKMKNIGKGYLSYEEQSASGIYDAGEYDEEILDDDDQEQFADLANQLAEEPDDEALMIAYQDAKKKMQYRDARRMLANSRVARDFYPVKRGGRGNQEKGVGKRSIPEFNGDCMRCGKYGHKARNCPQREQKQDSGKGSAHYVESSQAETSYVCVENVHVGNIYATGATNADFKAILDSGASETIVGVDTLQELWTMLDDLGFDARKEIIIDRDLRKTFVFGNSAMSEAIGLAKVTVGLFGKEKQIEVHVIEGSAPFLLSSKFMYENNIVVDFREGLVTMNVEGPEEDIQWKKLERAPSYHLMMSILDFPERQKKEDKEDHEKMENNGLGPMRSRTSSEGQPSE